jgi:hypothetical protein
MRVFASAAQNIKDWSASSAKNQDHRSRQQLSFIFTRNSLVLWYSYPPTSDSAQPFFNTHACSQQLTS